MLQTYLPAFNSAKSLPLPYTRQQMQNVKTSFQGMSVVTQQFGQIQAWGPELSGLNASDRQVYYTTKRLRGDTHSELAISWNYANDNGFSYPVPGVDLSNNLSTLRSLIIENINAGFKGVLLFLAGDGESNSTFTYNDPVGWTYGRAWLMANFKRIHDYLKDLDDYIIYVPGYDGVWYGWATPEDLINWFIFAKITNQVKYLAVEFCTGITYWETENDFHTVAGRCLDIVLQEFDGNLHQDSFWQICARQVGPNYVRPPDQPQGDDPNPPWLLSGEDINPIMYEYNTYQWVRYQINEQGVIDNANYGKAAGYKSIC